MALSKSTLGIIFSNIHDENVACLTASRAIGALPFACRYRLIDFTISSMVGADIINIGVITHTNYSSLSEHLADGKSWDLSHRDRGLRILTPFLHTQRGTEGLYTTRLDALKSIEHFIVESSEEYVVMADCDAVCNFDMKHFIKAHIASGADITFAAKEFYIKPGENVKREIMICDECGNINDIIRPVRDISGTFDLNLNIVAMSKRCLELIIKDAVMKSKTDFIDAVRDKIPNLNVKKYSFEGYFKSIGSLLDYYDASMQVLEAGVQRSLFDIRPVYTNVRNSPPTRYGKDGHVSNSLVADGCIIEGQIENSIIFRDVKVSRGAVVKNSVIMQKTYIAENTSLNCVVADRNVVISDGKVLSGSENFPLFIDKGSMI